MTINVDIFLANSFGMNFQVNRASSVVDDVNAAVIAFYASRIFVILNSATLAIRIVAFWIGAVHAAAAYQQVRVFFVDGIDLRRF